MRREEREIPFYTTWGLVSYGITVETLLKHFLERILSIIYSPHINIFLQFYCITSRFVLNFNRDRIFVSFSIN